ncbi:MAG: bifunctional isocitrate dehydrogenase kinase/phosphatase, partial [Acidobacteriota bacterium]|nr:bifunctional isocitrate dehydrogenase kinase/phosphatase [Acidobacteriota bacterium]
ARIRQAVDETFGSTAIEAIDVLRPVFVRNKAAYIVARARSGNRVMPLLMSILNGDDGLEVDAVLHTEERVSIVFSFARWYFHADVENPRAVIGFLHSILPRKRTAELYISMGYNKHGKTELYNDLMTTIGTTDEQFVIAPGKRGLVMSVFTLPSYEFVFKVIRDAFPAPKSVTPDEVRARYREVLQHDRVGRLVDFQEFEHLEFPRRRFSAELLDELRRTASGTVEIATDAVIVRHLYVGRRVTPLDLFLQSAPPNHAEAVVVDWGYTLKELAAANIFAGDMLLKNFGVTRHGRVVFYDYDEICPLTDCRFRTIPPARSDWDELAPEPWFSVGNSDVFPQELRSFTSLDGRLEQVFDTHHADLFSVDFWKEMQKRNRSGEIIDFFPYDDRSRLRPLGHAARAAPPAS